jgi:hypothetical protein
VPAYATAAAGAQIAAEPEPQRRTRRGRVVAPEQPGEEISQEEFEDLVRDLDIEEARTETGPRRGRAGAALATRTPDRSKVRPAADGGPGTEAAAPSTEATPVPDTEAAPALTPAAAPEPAATDTPPVPAADATPEELVLKDKPARRPSKRPRNRRHGRRR